MRALKNDARPFFIYAKRRAKGIRAFLKRQERKA